MQSKTRTYKALRLRAAVGVVLLVCLLALPQGRAWAQVVVHTLFVRLPSNIAGYVQPMDSEAPPAPTASSLVAAEQYSIAEIRARASFEVQAPARMPQGFRLVSTYYEPETSFVSFGYERDGGGISIVQMATSSPNFEAQREAVGAGATIESVQIGTLAGEFVQGNWDTKDGKVVWNPEYPYMRLRWIDGGVYRQVATEPGQPSSLTRKDLIAIAESMR